MGRIDDGSGDLLGLVRRVKICLKVSSGNALMLVARTEREYLSVGDGQ